MADGLLAPASVGILGTGPSGVPGDFNVGDDLVVTDDAQILGDLTIGADATLRRTGANELTVNTLKATGEITGLNDHAARQRALLAGQGLKGEVAPRISSRLGTTAAAGTIWAGAVGLLAGDVVTNIYVHVTANGNTLTLAKAGLYSKTGTRLAQSADVDTDFNSGTVPRVQAVALSAPYTVLTTDLYYLTFITVGTTGPSLLRAYDVNAALTAIGSNSLPIAKSISQTDLPSSFTPASAEFAQWMGWS